MTDSKLSGALIAITGVGLAIGLSVSAATADMVPHRAIYSLSLGKADSSGRFIGVSGAVKTSVERTCDAWITAEQVDMRVETQVGGELLQNLEFTGWESLDGRNYR
ncbi:MAG: EipB family protein, partial [Rhodospirillales bacterium]